MAFSQSLAAEVGEAGIRVIAFAPGFVDAPGLREAAHGLAPRMGMEPDQFMAVSMHPAYQGAMPPEHVAAALAYLVAVLADEYHGDRTDGYAVLERARFLKATQPTSVATPGKTKDQTQAGVPRTSASNPGDSQPVAGLDAGRSESAHLAQALDLAPRLQAAISETKAEFDRMPIFLRPMIRKAFAAKAGQAIQEWVETASRLHDGLRGPYRMCSVLTLRGRHSKSLRAAIQLARGGQMPLSAAERERIRAYWQERRQREEASARLRRHEALEKARLLATWLKEKWKAKEVYLYGSLVLDEAFDHLSDIDLFVVGLPTATDYWRMLAEGRELARPFSPTIVTEEDALPSLRQKVLREGMAL